MNNQTTAPATITILKTKEVAEKFGITPVALRRVLRTMPEYADGVHTNYKWDEKDTKALRSIETAIAKVKKDKEAKAKEAKAKLEAAKKETAKAA